MLVVCLILYAGLRFFFFFVMHVVFMTCCFHFDFVLEIILWIWCFHFGTLRNGPFMAAVVALGQQHDFLCKNESKCLFRDMTHNATWVMLLVKWPYFLSMCLTVLNLAFSDTSAFQLCKNNNARITILLISLLFHLSSFPQNTEGVSIPIFVCHICVTQT